MKKVVLFLLTVTLLATVAVLMYVGFSQHGYEDVEVEDYSSQIKELSDTIQKLRGDIEVYQAEIAKINLERDNIKKELSKILTKNEEIDNKLATGSVDDNVKFLSEFLSKGNHRWKGHSGGTDKGTAGDGKQVTE